MSQLQRTSPVVLLARVQEALLNVTPGIEVATNEGEWGMFVAAGPVGASCGMFVAAGPVESSEHAAKKIVRALLSTTLVIRSISHLALRGRVMT
jgi:hypothetical protein